ncbi:MAG: galactokinase family protein [Verrucomicrobiota bacterium]
MTIEEMYPITSWQAMLADENSGLFEHMVSLYGNRKLIEEPMALLKRCIDEFARSYGDDREVFVVRSPGRVNLLGMHVDHRGSSVNPIAIKEAFFIVEPRQDDTVVLRDVNSDRFPEESFAISRCLPDGEKIKDWDSWCHDEFEKRKDDPSISSSNYVRAGVLYFQHLNTAGNGERNPAFRGMNIMMGSNVPPAAGLSTSSCLVVASALAALHANGLEVDPMELCEQCGFAEWYVGTRGGFGDHAAIVMGRNNRILHMTAFPFTVDSVPFSGDYRIVLANSLVEAKKQVGAKDGYNTPLASYAFGLWLARKNFPQYAEKMEHLRDINPKTLGVDEAGIYRILKSMPDRISREEVRELFPEKTEELEHLFRSHGAPADGYRVRQVCMYGISECIRADLAVQYLNANNMEAFGKLVSLHHDGDRVARLGDDGEMAPEEKEYSDAKMDELISRVQSGDEDAHVWAQAGAYNVSVPEIDMLVDLALQKKGVVGAGLTGAGLGGSMIALVKAESAQEVVDHLAENYYRKKGLPAKVEVVKPVAGAGILGIGE